MMGLWIQCVLAAWAVVCALAAWPSAAQTAVSAVPRPAAYRPDRILVQPKAGRSPAALAQLHAAAGAQVRARFAAMGDLQVLRLPRGLEPEAAVRRYEQSGLVEFAEPDYWAWPATTPNDPRLADESLWHLHNTGQSGGTVDADIDAPEAWETLNSASNIIVALVDTGMRYTHEDLASNVWVNPGEIAGNGRDDDGNGFVDDLHGINAAANTGDPWDVHGHGTKVAGMVGAVGNNSRGVVGVAWRVQLMPCRFYDDAGNGSLSDAVQCFDYARAKGARVINASFVATAYSSALYTAISACRSAGIIVVAAAGNDTVNTDGTAYYPASFNLDNIVAVAATTRTDTLASYSNYGATTVDLAAPGSSIYTTASSSDSAYAWDSGTSFASPIVAAAAALLAARYPAETYRQLIHRISATTDPLPSLAGKCVTGGRLNLSRALGPSTVAKLSLAPAGNLAASGSAGGPFTPAEQIYTLTNSGDGVLAWTLACSQPWVGFSATNGSLDPGATTDVTLFLNEEASLLPPGSYTGTAAFVNAANGRGDTTRTVALHVLSLGMLGVEAAPVFAPRGHVGGPFLPASQTYTLTNSGRGSLTWSATHVAPWVTLSAGSGELAAGAATTVVARLAEEAAQLAPGLYPDTLVFDWTEGTGAITRGMQLTVSAPPLLSGAPAAPDGGFQLTLRGEPGWFYVIETSPDCRTWYLVLTNQAAADGALIFTDPASPAPARRFYRARIGGAP